MVDIITTPPEDPTIHAAPVRFLFRPINQKLTWALHELINNLKSCNLNLVATPVAWEKNIYKLNISFLWHFLCKSVFFYHCIDYIDTWQKGYQGSLYSLFHKRFVEIVCQHLCIYCGVVILPRRHSPGDYLQTQDTRCFSGSVQLLMTSLRVSWLMFYMLLTFSRSKALLLQLPYNGWLGAAAVSVWFWNCPNI